MGMHLFFAAATAPSGMDRLRQIPGDFWVRIAIGVAVLIVAIILLRKLAKVNKVVLGAIIFLVVTIVGFNWIYERNEPAWATPAVQWLAEFFPSKGHAAR